MSRMETGLDAEKLLTEGSGGVGSNLRTFRPSPFAIGLDGPIGSDGVTREEFCAREKTKE